MDRGLDPVVVDDDGVTVIEVLATTFDVVPGISVTTATPIDPAPRTAAPTKDAVVTRTRRTTAARLMIVSGSSFRVLGIAISLSSFLDGIQGPRSDLFVDAS